MTYTKVCAGCGTEFEAKSKLAKRCRKNCGRASASKNAARTKKRTEEGVFFVGIDGEAVNRIDAVYHWEEINGEMVEIPTQKKVHVYDMLTVGDYTYVTPDGGQIHYTDALQHIWDSVAEYRAQGNARVCLVGFFFAYDFIQIFRTLPEIVAWRLFSKEGQARRRAMQAKRGWKRMPKVHVGPWRLDMLGNKRLTIQHRDYKGVTVSICDTGSFFQTSFINAINPADWLDPICTEEEFAIIKRGKEARGDVVTLAEQFAARAETVQYNATENIVLAKLMTRLDEGFRHSGINLRADQFYGPGQAAQKWMTNIGAPTSEELTEALTPELFKIFQGSYYGGWFEIFAHGHVPGTTWEYDITSAYPDVIRKLPCILCGEWRPDHDGELRIAKYEVTAARDAITGPLPHRKRDGSILRPRTTRGYHWADEVQAAERAGFVESYDSISDKWSWHARECEHKSALPFKEIEELFLERIKVGKKSPAGKAMKLVYNSAYGKMAQSVGQPKFASPVYASLITSGCRTKILNAIASHPNGQRDLVMVATDAVFFRTPHPNLDMRENTLGAWEAEEKHNLTLFMPGVYWDDKSRKTVATGAKISLKSRGISAQELGKSLASLDSQFTEWDGVTYTMDGDTRVNTWPSLTMYSEFGIVSLGQALARDKWYLAGTLIEYEEDGVQYPGVRRSISANASPKRYPGDFDGLFGVAALAKVGDVWRSEPYDNVVAGGEIVLDTVPYNKSFGHDLAVEAMLNSVISALGDAIGDQIRVLNGSD